MGTFAFRGEIHHYAHFVAWSWLSIRQQPDALHTEIHGSTGPTFARIRGNANRAAKVDASVFSSFLDHGTPPI
jgi:hypothetical protein